MRSHIYYIPHLLRMTVGVGFVVTSEHTNPAGWRVEVLLFEIARCLWICSFFYSNFEKQNRKGSPTNLIYPYTGKLTSFLIKQFFPPKKRAKQRPGESRPMQKNSFLTVGEAVEGSCGLVDVLDDLIHTHPGGEAQEQAADEPRHHGGGLVGNMLPCASAKALGAVGNARPPENAVNAAGANRQQAVHQHVGGPFSVVGADDVHVLGHVVPEPDAVDAAGEEGEDQIHTKASVGFNGSH